MRKHKPRIVDAIKKMKTKFKTKKQTTASTSILNTKPKVICFAGNPNVGKSSWINVLSKSSFLIGNYPGVTVEKKEAYVTWQKQQFHLIDLPGIYGLYHGANEENIARDMLLLEEVDVIVCVMDTTNFARNCELMLQLRELQLPMLILLNYKDEAMKQNIEVRLEELQRLLDIKVIFCSAQEGDQRDEIIHSIVDLSMESKDSNRHRFFLSAKQEEIFKQAVSFISSLQTSYHRFTAGQLALYAMKWCEQEQFYVDQLKQLNLPLRAGYDLLSSVEDCDLLSHRQQLKEACLTCIASRKDVRLHITMRIDRVLLHQVASIPLFLFMMMLMLGLVFLVSQPLTAWLDQFINQFVIYYIGKILAFLPIVVRLFLQRGVIQGVGGVLMFLPMLACFYFCLAFLEESGYFARVAFMFDRIMRPFGMSGRSFVSLLLGMGCNVPAILSTRSLHHEKARWLTALSIPLMSCSARLPIYLMFAYAFFPTKVALVLLSLYGIGCYLALLLAWGMNRWLPTKHASLFTIELPPYRWPSLSFLIHKVKVEVKSFLQKSLTIVCSSMMVLFLCSYYPNGRIEDSYLMKLAGMVAPIYEPLGFGNRIELIASLPGAIIAKENVIGFLGQTLVGDTEEKPLFRTFSYDLKKQIILFGGAVKNTITLHRDTSNEYTPLTHAIQQLWSDSTKELRAYCFLVYILLSIPCVMTFYALYREFGWRMVAASCVVMMILPYVISFLLFQGMSLVIS